MRTEAYLKSQSGFTLLECILSLSIASFVVMQICGLVELSTRYSAHLKLAVNQLHPVALAAHSLLKAIHTPYKILNKPVKGSRIKRYGSGKYQFGQIIKSQAGEFYIGKNRFKTLGLYRFSHGFRREVASIDGFTINQLTHTLHLNKGKYGYAVKI